jgi:nucleoside-diphosphate-sugar epimerase
MSPRIAILGAGGFIGGRAVEMLHLNGAADVRPVVRRPHNLASASRFALEGHIADALDEAALRAAFAECDVVVHAVAGDPAAIVGSITPVYRAAEQSGVRRLVYVSSASVHGQAPPSGTDERSPLSDSQPLEYNNAKVKAERLLLSLRARGSTEVVILRPGIVTGPRSSWQLGFARQILSGSAYWLDDGRGICNSVYVDNLVHAIHLASSAPGADAQAFIVGDAETVTWADLYRPIAEALGFDVRSVPNATEMESPPSWKDRFHAFRSRPAVKSKLALLPMRLRRTLETALSSTAVTYPSPWSHPSIVVSRTGPTASREMALLYRCATKLPHSKAAETLGYRPVVAFQEGCRRTLEWLAFAGFPVDTAYHLKRAAIERNG